MSSDDPIRSLLMNAIRGKGTYSPESRKTSPVNFLMDVAGVQQDKTDRSQFQIAGTRRDNNEKVIVRVHKKASSQFIPQKGDVMRADSIAVDQDREARPPWKFYSAGFFRAYPQNELCIHGYAQPTQPYMNPTLNNLSASVRVYDVGTNTIHGWGPELLKDDRIFQELLRALKPWEAQNMSSVTHDAKGKPIWENVMKGVSPMAMLKVGDYTMIPVYGPGFVEQQDGSLRRPTDEEILNRIMQREKFMETIKLLKEVVDTPHMARTPITIYPALSVYVGRDSLNGEKQDYMRFKDNFQWVDPNDATETDGAEKVKYGTRMAYLHVKQSRQDQLMAIDLFRDDLYPYVGPLPSTDQEKTMLASLAAGAQQQAPQQGQQVQQAQQQQAPRSVHAQQIPQQQQQQQPQQQMQQGQQAAPQNTQQQAPQQMQRQQVAQAVPAQQAPQQQQPQPAMQQPVEGQAYYQDSDIDEVPYDPNDYEMFAADMEAMERLNAGFEPQHDPELDDLMSEAEQRILKRRAGPTM